MPPKLIFISRMPPTLILISPRQWFSPRCGLLPERSYVLATITMSYVLSWANGGIHTRLAPIILERWNLHSIQHNRNVSEQVPSAGGLVRCNGRAVRHCRRCHWNCVCFHCLCWLLRVRTVWPSLRSRFPNQSACSRLRETPSYMVVNKKRYQRQWHSMRTHEIKSYEKDMGWVCLCYVIFFFV